MTKNDKPVSRQTFMEELRRYQKGSVTRRHFLGVTGLGAATAVLAGAIPGFCQHAPGQATSVIGFRSRHGRIIRTRTIWRHSRKRPAQRCR